MKPKSLTPTADPRFLYWLVPYLTKCELSKDLHIDVAGEWSLNTPDLYLMLVFLYVHMINSDIYKW